MEYVHDLVLFFYLLVILGTMVKVLLDNRQPVKTMAWLLVLVFMPVAGIVFYFFFGQDTRKEKVVSQHSLDQLTKRSMFEYVEQKDLTLPSEHQELIRLFVSQNLAMPFKDNNVDIYTSGYDFFPALLKAISNAKEHIHLDIYIFSDDALGQLVADALIAKSREGVDVKVIYDDVGSWHTHNSFFENMRNAGIEVHSFMPVKFPAFTGKVNYRNHRKLCIIDGRIGFIGGMNIALRYVKGTGQQAWRDTHLRIEGGAVYGLQRAFLVDWYFVDRTLLSDRKYYPPVTVRPNACLAQIVTSSPVSQWPDIMQGYVRILLAAKKYVFMQSPYFLPTEPVLFAMRTAALAGVDVRLMIPLHCDSKLVSWASRSYVMEAVEAGVKVLLYRGGFLHSKVIVCDDTLCSCGSTNVDFRSFENNFEVNAFIYDYETTLKMKTLFVEDETECVTTDCMPYMQHRPFRVRLFESLVRLLSPLL